MSACEPEDNQLDLTDLPSLSATIQANGLAADKRLGQHFLLDPAILRRIARTAGDLRGKTVLEVGPGPGGLTRALLEAGASVIAIERDPRCIQALQSLCLAARGQLELIEADALDVDFAALLGDQRATAIANLPYNVGTEILVRWLLTLEHFDGIYVLLQREVAERLVAVPRTKAFGRLSVLTQLLCSARRAFDLPAGAFHPPPKVTSSLVSLTPLSERPAGTDLANLQVLTAAAFQQRRKMLRRSLLTLGRPLDVLLSEADISPDSRPDALTPQDFWRLARVMSRA